MNSRMTSISRSQPEDETSSPFLSTESFTPIQKVETPEESAPEHQSAHLIFNPDYQVLDSDTETADPAREENSIFLNELYDEEFNDEIYALLSEAEEQVFRQLSKDANGTNQQDPQVARNELESFFTPIRQDLELIFDNMLDETEELDDTGVSSLSDSQIQLWVDSFFTESELSDEVGIEHGILSRMRSRRRNRRARRKAKRKRVWRRFRKKVGKMVRKVKRLGKRVLRRMLGRLKRHAKTLLKFVLEQAVNKVPSRYRPYAKMLQKKLLKSEFDGAEHENLYSQEGIVLLQVQLDHQLAQLTLDDNELTQWESIPENQPLESHAKHPLSLARQQFVQGLHQLREGEAPEPLVENFVVAILKSIRFVAKPIIKAIGRDKVIKYLAKYVAKLTGRFIRKRNINQLVATALTDVGLRAMRMETTGEDSVGLAAEAIAGLVEGTVMETLELPNAVLENTQVLELQVIGAFEKAVAANLPPLLSEQTYEKHPKLQEVGLTPGAWIHLPLRSRQAKPPLYKKWTRVIPVRLTAHIADRVRSFGEVPISTILRDHLGIKIGNGVDAQVHLFESLPGTSLSDIARHEGFLSNVKDRYQFSHWLFHPLTPTVATGLLGEPNLGKSVPVSFIQKPYHIRSGQRFYYLEIPGAQPRFRSREDESRIELVSELRIHLDFITTNLAISLYLNESKARHFASLFGQRSGASIVSSEMANLVRTQLSRAFHPCGLHNMRIIHPDVIPGLLSARALRRLPMYVLSSLASSIRDWAMSAIIEDIPARQGQFLQAVDNQQEGATIVLSMHNPPSWPVIRSFLSNRGGSVPADLFLGAPETSSISVRPGLQYDIPR